VEDENWTLHPTFTDPPGTDDDSHNNDEDLHDRNDVVWVNDGPGTFGDARSDLRQTEYAFVEFVHLVLNKTTNEVDAMDGLLVSQQLHWYAIVNLKKDATSGNWVRNLARRNEVREGTLTIGDDPQ